MNSLAETVLYVYLIVFLSMLVFDIVTIFYRKVNEAHLLRLELAFEEAIADDVGKEISLKHKKMLTRKLKKIGCFIAFTRVLERMDEDKRKAYLTGIKEVFLQVYTHYRSKEIIRETYFIHFLAQYPYILDDKMRPLIAYVINCTKSSSIYLRENALNVLYNVGNVMYIKEAFYYMNYFNVIHHHKLITDGLLRFKGDEDKLVKMLIEEFESYTENYKVACINYFAYKRIDCREEVYRILTTSSEEKEVRLACIRYFASMPYEQVLSVLEVLLEDDKQNWEYSAVAAFTLRKYPGKKSVNLLLTAIQSHNWYVRNNAASSLIHLTKKEKHKELFENIDDKYAKEALNYQLHLKGEAL